MPPAYFKCNFKAQFAEVNCDGIFLSLEDYLADIFPALASTILVFFFIFSLTIR